MRAGKAGEFDGVSITMNSDYSAEERVYYMVHALGSIVPWSLSRDAVQRLFDELRDAKKTKHEQPERFEAAIQRYRDFETESSKYAVWLLTKLGYGNVVASYSNFMRADLDSMTQFHRTGQAPVWRTFFEKWNRDVATGRRHIELFSPKPIPHFQPVKTENQEILQRQEGEQGD